MPKYGITKTLQESLMLQAEFERLHEAHFKSKDEREKEILEKQINLVKNRLYVLPNYNMAGLEKLMKFFKPYTSKEANV